MFGRDCRAALMHAWSPNGISSIIFQPFQKDEGAVDEKEMVALEAKVIELTAEVSSLNAECKVLEQRMQHFCIWTK